MGLKAGSPASPSARSAAEMAAARPRAGSARDWKGEGLGMSTSGRGLAAVAGDGDEAEEAQGGAGGAGGCGSGAELVLVVWGDEDDVAGLDGVLAAVEEDGASALDDVDLVLVVVGVTRGVSAGFEGEVSQGEVGGAVVAADEDGHADALDAGDLDGFGGCGVEAADEAGGHGGRVGAGSGRRAGEGSGAR